MKNNTVIHPIAPVYDGDSEILILGSFPSVKSRENGFFYGHPQNRFWRVLALVYEAEKYPHSVPSDNDSKREFLINHKIALWDVIAGCEIEGSSDTSIKNAVPNDITPILETGRIRKIFLNGKTAEKLYKKYIGKTVVTEAVYLPSTSPANAAWTVEKLALEWKKLLFL